MNFLFGEDAHIGAQLQNLASKDGALAVIQGWRDDDELHFIKTHEVPLDDSPAIYFTRHGLDACIALSHFWNIPLTFTITGQRCSFGTYSAFYHIWQPFVRPHTFFMRYEELEADADAVADRMGKFIGMEPKKKFQNRFDECKGRYKLFRDREGCRETEPISDHDRALFWKCHGQAMRELGYVA